MTGATGARRERISCGRRRTLASSRPLRPLPCRFVFRAVAAFGAWLLGRADASGFPLGRAKRGDEVWSRLLGGLPQGRQPARECLRIDGHLSAPFTTLGAFEAQESFGRNSEDAAQLSEVLDRRDADPALPVGHSVLGVSDAESEGLLSHAASFSGRGDSLPDLAGVVGVDSGGHVHLYLYARSALGTRTLGQMGPNFAVLGPDRSRGPIA